MWLDLTFQGVLVCVWDQNYNTCTVNKGSRVGEAKGVLAVHVLSVFSQSEDEVSGIKLDKTLIASNCVS